MRHRRTLVAALAVVCVLAVVWSGRTAVQLIDGRGVDGRAAALEAAADFSTALVNVTPETVESDLEKLQRYATGEVAEQISGNAASQAEVITTIQSVTEGTVVAAGVQSIGDDRAVVLVALRADQAVGDSTQTIGYRMKVSLREGSDGWKVAEVEFVE